MAPTQEQYRQPKQRKLEAAPPQPPAAVAATSANTELEEFQEQPQPQPQPKQQQEQDQEDPFSQHLASIHEAALESRARLHDKLDEVLKGAND